MPVPVRIRVGDTTWSFSGLLFDFDGVLADSTAGVVRHWEQFAGRHGLDPVPILDVSHGVPCETTIARLCTEHALGVDAGAEIAWFKELELGDTADIVPLPGSLQLLSTLPAGSWGIYTACSRDLIAARMGAARLPMPETVVTAQDVAAGKPDPEGFVALARLLGCAPAECVVFEDSPAGVAAGRAAGAAVIAVTTTHDRERLEGADAYIDDLDAVMVLP